MLGVAEHWLTELLEIALLLHVTTFVLAWVRHRLGSGWLRHSLGRQDAVGLLSGALLGLFMPVCTCGVGAVYASLLENGAAPRAAAAFLFAAPAINEFVLLLILVMLGPIGAVAYAVAGLAAAVLAGRFAERLYLTPVHDHDDHDHHDHPHDHGELVGIITPPIDTPLRSAFRDTFALTRRLALPLVIATACVALLQALDINPFGFITRIGHAWFAPIVAALVGLPLHVETSLLGSVFLPLVKIGLPLGTIISLMMATTVATVPEAVVLRRIVGWRGVWGMTCWFFIYTAVVGLSINAIVWMYR
jgi:uncharacterized membrane protein YraQ (UPF0718 family)